MSEGAPDYASLRAAPRLELQDVVPLRAPFTLYLEPTNVCNFKCSYCPVHFDDYAERSGGLGKLSLEECEHVYDEILTLGRLKTLNLYMLGEPFANRHLTAMIALAKRKGVADRVIVTTNATLLDEATAQRVIESGLDYLRVSVYGVTDESLRFTTGSTIPAARIVANVERLKRLRDQRGLATPFIYAKTIETADRRENELFLETFAPIADQVEIEPAMNWNLAQETADLSGLGGSLAGTAHFRRTKSACPFPFYTLVVNADLRVTVCCVDWEQATEIGNLRTESLREIWTGDALRAFRMAHLRGERASLPGCASCTYLHTAPDSIDDLSAEVFAARHAAAAARSAAPSRPEAVGRA